MSGELAAEVILGVAEGSRNAEWKLWLAGLESDGDCTERVRGNLAIQLILRPLLDDKEMLG